MTFANVTVWVSRARLCHRAFALPLPRHPHTAVCVRELVVCFPCLFACIFCSFVSHTEWNRRALHFPVRCGSLSSARLSQSPSETQLAHWARKSVRDVHLNCMRRFISVVTISGLLQLNKLDVPMALIPAGEPYSLLCVARVGGVAERGFRDTGLRS